MLVKHAVKVLTHSQILRQIWAMRPTRNICASTSDSYARSSSPIPIPNDPATS